MYCENDFGRTFVRECEKIRMIIKIDGSNNTRFFNRQGCMRRYRHIGKIKAHVTTRRMADIKRAQGRRVVSGTGYVHRARDQGKNHQHENNSRGNYSHIAIKILFPGDVKTKIERL